MVRPVRSRSCLHGSIIRPKSSISVQSSPACTLTGTGLGRQGVQCRPEVFAETPVPKRSRLRAACLGETLTVEGRVRQLDGYEGCYSGMQTGMDHDLQVYLIILVAV